ncbi:MAG: hypothetical protein E7437_04500 [Ruminococcaceae bacterium]|nr:hypothetical protein [Oscillospiraceae bacterium]
MKSLFSMLLAMTVVLFCIGCGAPAKEAITTMEPAASFQEIQVVDNEYCTIKITGIEPDAMFGYTLKTYLENKSSDTTYMFSVQNAAINGVQEDPAFATEVAPGKMSNEKITFMDDSLEEILGTFTDIEINFRVYDSNDWLADPVAEVSTHVYPIGQENATVYQRSAQESDQILVDDESFTIIVTDYDPDGFFGYTVNLYLVNKTEANVMISADEVSVNGYMADPFFATTVAAGKSAFASMSWSESDFEENGITDVEAIEFTLSVSDADDWLAEEYFNEIITLEP